MATSPKQVVKDILAELPTLLAVAVVETETGMPLASHTNIADFDIETAAAYNTEVVKAKLKAIAALKLNQTVQDILLTLTDQLHLLKLSPKGDQPRPGPSDYEGRHRRPPVIAQASAYLNSPLAFVSAGCFFMSVRHI